VKNEKGMRREENEKISRKITGFSRNLYYEGGGGKENEGRRENEGGRGRKRFIYFLTKCRYMSFS